MSTFLNRKTKSKFLCPEFGAVPCNHRRGLSFGCWKFSLEEEEEEEVVVVVVVEVGVACNSCFDFDYVEIGCQSSSWYVKYG